MTNVKPIISVKQFVLVTGKVQSRHVLKMMIKKAEKLTQLYLGGGNAKRK